MKAEQEKKWTFLHAVLSLLACLLFVHLQYVFSASEYPHYVPIPQHIEMSFLPAPPRWLYFCCLDAPKNPKGGETSLCDFRKVYRELNPEFKRKLYKKKVCLVGLVRSLPFLHPSLFVIFFFHFSTTHALFEADLPPDQHHFAYMRGLAFFIREHSAAAINFSVLCLPRTFRRGSLAIMHIMVFG